MEQVYLSRAETGIDRPARWLAGFASVQLAAGASRRITVPVAARSFEHWDAGWQLEPGTFTLHLGTSVTETLFSIDVAR